MHYLARGTVKGIEIGHTAMLKVPPPAFGLKLNNGQIMGNGSIGMINVAATNDQGEWYAAVTFGKLECWVPIEYMVQR